MRPSMETALLGNKSSKTASSSSQQEQEQQVLQKILPGEKAARSSVTYGTLPSAIPLDDKAQQNVTGETLAAPEGGVNSWRRRSDGGGKTKFKSTASMVDDSQERHKSSSLGVGNITSAKNTKTTKADTCARTSLAAAADTATTNSQIVIAPKRGRRAHTKPEKTGETPNSSLNPSPPRSGAVKTTFTSAAATGRGGRRRSNHPVDRNGALPATEPDKSSIGTSPSHGAHQQQSHRDTARPPGKDSNQPLYPLENTKSYYRGTKLLRIQLLLFYLRKIRQNEQKSQIFYFSSFLFVGMAFFFFFSLAF